MRPRSRVLGLASAMLLLASCGTGASPAGGGPRPAPTVTAAAAAPATAEAAAPAARPSLEPVKLAVAAKSLAFLPYYFGQQRGLYAEQGLDVDVAVIQPSTAIAATIAGEVGYT